MKAYLYQVEYSIKNNEWHIWGSGIRTRKQAKIEKSNCKQYHVNTVDIRILKVYTDSHREVLP